MYHMLFFIWHPCLFRCTGWLFIGMLAHFLQKLEQIRDCKKREVAFVIESRERYSGRPSFVPVSVTGFLCDAEQLN